MPRTRECDYCGADIEPGTGTMLVRTSGTTTHFCSSKCENNADLGRDARNLEWTEAGRQTTAAEDAQAQAVADEAAAAAEEADAEEADDEAAAETEEVADETDEASADTEDEAAADSEESDDEETEEAEA